MEQNKYQHSDKLPLSLVVEELEKDAEFPDKALQILFVEDSGSTHTTWTAVSALISHWLTNRDLNCYINGKLVDDVTDLTVLPVDEDYGAGIKALDNWMTIRKDELAALLEHRNLAVPAFLRPSVKVSAEANAKKSNQRPPLQQLFQEQEILRVIRSLSHNPKMLPKQEQGKPGIKADVRQNLTFSPKVFDKAWERLRANQDIQDAE